MASQDLPVTNIVLVGRQGSGKSSTSNTLLGKKMFDLQKLGGLKTRCEMYRAATPDGPIINVIDVPGLFDSAVSEEYLSKEMINCFNMAEEGIHAVLFVLSVRNRISQLEESTLKTLLNIFDSKILNYFIVVFTGGDELEAENQSLDDYLCGCPEFLTRIISLCGGRKVLFDNKTTDKDKKAQQLNQLLAHVTAIGKQNGGIPYTDKMRRKIKLDEQELDIEANLAEAELERMNEKSRQYEDDQTMNMMTHTVENVVKQSATSHKRDIHQLNDIQTMNMMTQMVDYALKQSLATQEREMCQLKDTQTMMEQMLENALRQSRIAHEKEMCQLKDTLQLKDAQTMNMIEKMIEKALKQRATVHEREILELKDTLQQDRHRVLSPRKSTTCECNIM